MKKLDTVIEQRHRRRQENKKKLKLASVKNPPPVKPGKLPSHKVRCELYCHDCGRYVQFTIDAGLNGKHVLNCPNCDHEHYRVVRGGRITAERWGRDPRQNVQVYYATNISTSPTAAYDSNYGTGTASTDTGIYGTYGGTWANT